MIAHMSLYTDLRDAGVPLDSHESDLYAKLTDESRAIVSRSRRGPGMVRVFRNAIDGTLWYDLPFAFDPFWEKAGLSKKGA